MPVVYLIPSLLHEEGIHAIPSYVIEAVKNCQSFFVENERTARRYLKQLWRVAAEKQGILIDNYEWFDMSDEQKMTGTFRQKIKERKNIGIISEAGCPGVADPGQTLVGIAQEMNIEVKPLVGPNSIVLALMASGMNGQQFQFVGYLPIDRPERNKAIKALEAESKRKNCTQIFIETPYRNNQLLEALLSNCSEATRLCVAVDLTGKNEWIKTKKIADWSEELLSENQEKLNIHKRLAIFLLLAE